MSPDGKIDRRTIILRLGLATRVYIAVLVLGAALVFVGVLAWVDSGQQARLRYEREIQDGLDIFKSDYDRATQDLLSLGNWLVDQESFVELVQKRDGAGLARYIGPWTEVSIADSIAVSDAAGDVISQSRAGQPTLQGGNILDWTGAKEALSGKRSSGLGRDQADRLQGWVALPAYSSDKQALVGAVILGFYIDGSFLQYRARKPDQEIAFVYDGNLTLITLTDQQGKPWRGTPAPQSVIRAQREAKATEFMVLDTDVGRQLFKFKPMQTLGETMGMYGIGVPLTAIDIERIALFRMIGLGFAVIAAGQGLVGFLFVRSLISPIRKLQSFVQSMTDGDLSKRVALRRDDELGDLAQNLDEMRKQLYTALESLTLEKSRSAAVLESMGIAAVVTDHKLKIVSVNPMTETLLRQSQAALVGKYWHEIFLDGNDGSSQWSVGGLGQVVPSVDQPIVIHGRFASIAYPEMILDVISTPIKVKGTSTGYIHVLQDATSQDQLIRAKDEFMVNAAHELRSPLASLRSSVETLVEDYPAMSSQDLGFMLRTMRRAVVRFQGLVENLVDIGNIEAGRFRVRPLPTRLDTLIDNAVSQVAPLLQGRGQVADVTLDGVEECTVLADRPRIIQVLINLLTNASKYGPDGQPIAISASKKDGYLLIQVSDCGPGIPVEEQSHLFLRFYRGRRAEEEGIGIGLGLALSREVILAHGGDMDVKSHPGQGTTFWFTLRRVDSEPSQPLTPVAREIAAPSIDAGLDRA